MRVLMFALMLVPILARANQDPLDGVEYTASVLARPTMTLCNGPLNDFERNLMPLYVEWERIKIKEIANGKHSVEQKLDGKYPIAQFEAAAILKNQEEFQAASTEQKLVKCASFHNLIKASLDATKGNMSLTEASPDLKLSCALVSDSSKPEKNNFVVDIYLKNKLIKINSKGTFSASIDDNQIGWDFPFGGSIFHTKINRYTGEVLYGTDEFPSLWTGSCRPVSERKF